MMPIRVMPICTAERNCPRIFGEPQRHCRAAVPPLAQLLQPRPPRGDDGELRHGEEGVEQDQQQHDPAFEKNGHKGTGRQFDIPAS